MFGKRGVAASKWAAYKFGLVSKLVVILRLCGSLKKNLLEVASNYKAVFEHVRL